MITMQGQPAAPGQQPRFGRLYAPDARDLQYVLDQKTLDSLPRALRKRRTLPWKLGPVLDQGSTSECTVFAAAHWYQSSPLMKKLGWDRAAFTRIYREAQKIDEWPGENYNGTSERAVMKVLRDEGYVQEWLMVAPDPDIAKEHLVIRGGLLIGSDWFDKMLTPDSRGYVEPGGAVVGGHEYFIRWYHNKRHYKYPDTYECVNSWGTQWGYEGRFFIKADALEYLWLSLNGDVITAIEPGVSIG